MYHPSQRAEAVLSGTPSQEEQSLIPAHLTREAQVPTYWSFLPLKKVKQAHPRLPRESSMQPAGRGSEVTENHVCSSAASLASSRSSGSCLHSTDLLFLLADLMSLKRMMEKLGVPKTHLEMKKMISEVTGGVSDTISYRDFVNMMLGKRSAVLKL